MAIFLKGTLRKRRVLIVAVLLVFLWVLLPINSYNLPRRLLSGAPVTSPVDILRYVNPLIGTANGGHVFPGATLPYGMAKAGADVNAPGWEIAAGFVSDDSKITGFSHLHDSGTGGSPSLGNFPLFAHPGCPEDDYTLCNFTTAQRATERVNGTTQARPGYFAIGLSNSVHVEMAATQHATLYKFNFPGQAEIETNGIMVRNSPLILLDLVDLGNTRSGGNVEVDPVTGRILGNGTFLPSFGRGHYEAHFCVDFSNGPVRKSGTFRALQANETMKAIGGEINAGWIAGGSAGAWVQFDRAPEDHILARVGLSFISVDKACSNAENEIADFGFERMVQDSESAWRDKLSVIEADHTGLNDDLLTTFWSGLYRVFLSPQDYTGENPRWDSEEPYFDSFYCIWDSFRVQHPLLTLVDAETQTRMVRALISIYKNEGKLPDCRMAFSKGFTQGGSNADVVLADAFIKNLTDGIDWKLGYEAVISDAEIEPKYSDVEGRGNLDSYKLLGYIPSEYGRSISRTMEYAYDDFSIAQMAAGLGKKTDEKKYLERSNDWQNVFNNEQEDRIKGEDGKSYKLSDFTGFVQPRLRNGSFHFQDTLLCSPVHEQHQCYMGTQYATYEGSPWLYSFYVPQDMASLIVAMGGKKAFVDRLNFFHASGIIYMGNEQSFLPTYQFHYAGRPGLSCYWIHQYIPRQFNSSINGIPGNDDSAMGAFTAFAFMGFFPVAGQDVYLLTPPLFREVSLRTPSGKLAIIRNIGFDPTYDAKYVQSAKLNGKPYTRSWIMHDFFVNGGVLEFTLGKTESLWWGTRDVDLPPSMSTRSLIEA